MRLRLAILAMGILGGLGAALAIPSSPHAVEPRYFFVGGTPAQRAQVHAALEASAFDWSRLPPGIEVRIARGPRNFAKLGKIRLSAELLDRGRASWGTVQHEFAHQVDLLLLDDADRALLRRSLGGREWFARSDSLPHHHRTAERFASTLAWAYWPDPRNSMRPRSRHDESAAMEPAHFRAHLARILAADA